MSKAITESFVLRAIELNSLEFNDLLMSMMLASEVEKFLVKLLKIKCDNQNTRRIKRAHSRLNKIRAQEERVMISHGKWYN